MGQNGFDRGCVSVVFLFLLCFIAHSYEANGGTDMEVLACFRPVFLWYVQSKETSVITCKYNLEDTACKVVLLAEINPTIFRLHYFSLISCVFLHVFQPMWAFHYIYTSHGGTLTLSASSALKSFFEPTVWVKWKIQPREFWPTWSQFRSGALTILRSLKFSIDDASSSHY